MISIVIPNFNGAKLLAKNLPKLVALLDKSKLNYEIILADDASTDDSVVIANKFGLKVIGGDKNIGFASTVDRGIRKARGEIVFTLKTDALPESENYFKLMLAHFKNPKTFAVSAALRTVEKGREEVRGQGVLIFFRGFFLHFRTQSDYVDWLQTMRTTRNLARNTKYEIRNTKYSMWADGGAMAVRRDLYLKIGGFDSLYNPFYWEDVDLGYRAWKAGYQIDFEPRARLLHDFESGAIAKHHTKERVQIISQRNQFIFVWKNGDLKHLIYHLSFIIYHCLVALKNANGTYFQALWLAFLLWPRILAARWRQKKVSELSDDQVLALLAGGK